MASALCHKPTIQFNLYMVGDFLSILVQRQQSAQLKLLLVFNEQLLGKLISEENLYKLRNLEFQAYDTVLSNVI